MSMSLNPNIAEVASLIAEPTRATILMGLLDGRTLPASELARMSQITPQTASAHLSKMVEAGLLVMESHGRHRYYRIANEHVAHALEALMVISPVKKVRSLRESDQTKALCYARTCYDHLAGKVGVALTEAIVRLGFIEPSGLDYGITPKGTEFFTTFGINIENLRKGRRMFARQCLDWSERRYHLAGALGSALADRLFGLGWIVRIPGRRAVRITELGNKGLFQTFGLQLRQD
jgi:DNA-binding transcriptional ArsR family regulator